MTRGPLRGDVDMDTALQPLADLARSEPRAAGALVAALAHAAGATRRRATCRDVAARARVVTDNSDGAVGGCHTVRLAAADVVHAPGSERVAVARYRDRSWSRRSAFPARSSRLPACACC